MGFDTGDPVSASQTMTVLSQLPVTTRLLSRLKATVVTRNASPHASRASPEWSFFQERLRQDLDQAFEGFGFIAALLVQ